MWCLSPPAFCRRFASLLQQQSQGRVCLSSSSSSMHLRGPRQQHQQQQRRVFSSNSSSSGSGGPKNKLLLTLASPTESFFLRSPVLSVSVPGSEGQMTITNNHSPLAARLKAGEILVYEKEGAPPSRFFLSDGFAFVHTFAFSVSASASLPFPIRVSCQSSSLLLLTAVSLASCV
ncbi:hypothetical protein Efla_003373 [Eimeria flavescens]